MSKIYYSPDTDDTLEFRYDGLLVNPKNDSVYEIDYSGKVIPVKDAFEVEDIHLDNEVFSSENTIEKIYIDVSKETRLVEEFKVEEERQLLLPEPETVLNVTDEDITKAMQNLENEKIELPQLKENDHNSYEEDRKEIMDLYNEQSNIHSVFTVNGDICYHHLIKMVEGRKQIIKKKIFPYNSEFRKQLLEKTIIDYAKRNPMGSSRILLPEIKSKIATYETTSGNNKLTINNLPYNYAKAISDFIKQIDYVLYRRELPDAEGLTLTKAKNGFISALPFVGLVAFLCGLGIILASLFVK